MQDFNSLLNKIKEIYDKYDLDFKLQEPTTIGTINEAEVLIGKELSNSYKDFLLTTNGSNYEIWGAMGFNGSFPISFNSIEESIKYYKMFLPYNEQFYNQWNITEEYARELNEVLDPRIKPFLHHKYWFPIADFAGGTATAYLDMDPSETGVHGQIIMYLHDPDFIYYQAPNFLEFLEIAVNFLEENHQDIFD